MKKRVFGNFEEFECWFSSNDLKRILPKLECHKLIVVNNKEEFGFYDGRYLLYQAYKTEKIYPIYAKTILDLQSYASRYFKDDRIWGGGSRNGRLLRISADMSLKEALSYIDDEIQVNSKEYLDNARKTEVVSSKLWRNQALSEFVTALDISSKLK